MAEINVTAAQWRLVEVGRVVLFTHGLHTDCLAVIVEIIDHKRVRPCFLPSPANPRKSPTLTKPFQQVLVDGPSKTLKPVPRHAAPLNNLIITPIVIPKLPRAAGRTAVAKAWEKAEVEQKWAESAWAKRREQREKRRALTDFDRFKVMRLKKQVCARSPGEVIKILAETFHSL